jgi:adenine-specific DNA-methyltransferase
VIKYLGSKRRLVPHLGALLDEAGARTALDLFTGTTRVAQDWKRRGAEVWAVDLARYAHILARCYIETDAATTDLADLDDILCHLQHLPGQDGYVTATFSQASRYFQPHNARRIDAIRAEIEVAFAAHPLYPVLLASLLEAADRVDSTTGLQMAYLKQWSPRSHQPLTLRRPSLLAGPGHACQGDATELVSSLPEVDLAYLDPPYNQHRYFTNYHVWETLVAWDSPDHYGVACKRVGLDDLVDMAGCRGHVEVLGFDSRRYIGAQIGIHNPKGEKVGRVTHTRNVEYVVLAGDRQLVRRLTAVHPSEHRPSEHHPSGQVDSDSNLCHCHPRGVHPR